MKINLNRPLGVVLSLFAWQYATAQNANVDVNLNIKHSVGGVSDFGRERHITLHASLAETDWIGEEDKIEYLLNDLDVYLGRDNGSASWKFQATPGDPNRLNKPDIEELQNFGAWWMTEYEKITEDVAKYKDRSKGMIMGTNPHPTYPTLDYNYISGGDGPQWIPQDIETSAEWMVEYLDHFFTDSAANGGELLPEYWEVINEPDMLMNTGEFMVTSWEDLWEYHNLVAKGIRERMGSKAPKIGGMTWGLHDFFNDDLNRFRTVGYTDTFYGNTAEDEIAKAHARKQTESKYLNVTGPWTQWDVLWKGFMDNAGENMDFYAVHVYDWPDYDADGAAQANRTGGHTEAMLEMIEWYDVYKNGKENRKPIIISEYGAVQGLWEPLPHQRRYDWENIKPFSAMMMQFLERPDYIQKTLPFTPVKAEWWKAGTGFDYHYRMMEQDGDDWVWTDFIKWYQLWAEVEGTRVDTKSTDPDIQVDCYIDGNIAYLILNNLEEDETNIILNFFDDSSNSITKVSTKHLFLQGEQDITLSQNSSSEAPSSVKLAGDGTMILKYEFASPVLIDETSVESKYFGESVSGGTEPHRIEIEDGDNTFQINGVNVPANAEAMLKITGALFDDDDDKEGFLSITKLTVNGQEVPTPLDWRGKRQNNKGRYFGTLEIPIPSSVLKDDNTFVVDFKHFGEITVANLVVWDFSKAPGRTTEVEVPANTAVTGIGITVEAATVEKSQLLELSTLITPADASDKSVAWSSNNTNVATVDSSGVVKGIAEGIATITVTSIDGNYTATSEITVVSTPVSVTKVRLTPESETIEVDSNLTVTAVVKPSNASNKNVSWTSSNPSVATVSTAGLVTALKIGETTITATSADGDFVATSEIKVVKPLIEGGLILQAEDFTNTSGTFDDETVPLGVNLEPGVGINYVNTQDWVDYTINVPEGGEYSINYFIATENNQTEITMLIDGVEVAVDAVPNNSSWTQFKLLTAANKVNLTKGSHDVRIIASSATDWQWNLDKIVFTTDDPTLSNEDFFIDANGNLGQVFPVPASEIINVNLGVVSSDISVALVSLDGSIILSETYKKDFKFDVSKISSGIYFIVVKDEETSFSKTVIVN
ncbi:Ig-like domain-containing protein [Aquimarina agarivorans]|uniref:Ig-like domain-containing protein n=1 Tax=Aquimarina agarivorans TaxID=980584 RepID=UPI000248EC6E|nr:Ig-like domain-containing protein [Aquimarina agarivorans]